MPHPCQLSPFAPFALVAIDCEDPPIIDNDDFFSPVEPEEEAPFSGWAPIEDCDIYEPATAECEPPIEDWPPPVEPWGPEVTYGANFDHWCDQADIDDRPLPEIGG